MQPINRIIGRFIVRLTDSEAGEPGLVTFAASLHPGSEAEWWPGPSADDLIEIAKHYQLRGVRRIRRALRYIAASR